MAAKPAPRVLARPTRTPARAHRGLQTSTCSSRPAGTPCVRTNAAPRRLPPAGAAVHRLVDDARRSCALVGAEPRVCRGTGSRSRARALNASANCFVTTVRERWARRVGRAVPAHAQLDGGVRAPGGATDGRPAGGGAIPRTRSTSAPPGWQRRGGRRAAAGAGLLRGLDGACGADVYALCPSASAPSSPPRGRRLARRSARAGCSGAPTTPRASTTPPRAWCATMADDARLHEALCATPRPTRAATKGAVRLEADEHVFSVAICRRGS